MNTEDVQVKLGLYFTAVNLGALLLSGLVMIRFGLIPGLLSFFALVTVLIFLVQKKARRDIEEGSESE
ncbi:MAG: hypothetical protein ABEJ36_00420 [Candidatus Nanosalina sp.]